MKRRKKKKKNRFIVVMSFLLITICILSYFGVKYIMYKDSSNTSSPLVASNENSTDNTSKQSNNYTAAYDNKPNNAANSEISVLISAIGDCTIGTDIKFNKSVSLPAFVEKNHNDPNYLFGNVKSILDKDDLTIANLETTFTTSNSRQDKTFAFKGDPSLASSLKSGSIEGVNLSNNHIYDYGTAGFNDTLAALKSNEVNYFGEGYKWNTFVKGIGIAFLGYQGWSSDKTIENKIKADIAQEKAKGNIVIVSFHWGIEASYSPSSIQTNLAHFSIDNGADLVIGHHPHVIEGIEKYNNKYICYSLANFCFGGNSNPSDKDTFIFQTKLYIENNKISKQEVKAIPCRISSTDAYNDYKPTPLEGNEKLKLLEKLNKLSMNLDFKITDDFQ
ncbi:CapA family protein [Clostridium sp. 19966]|uniref:CapA family protein n=1 Tax=Clostridium sp. 19966 TaxID=2768166 RepID=UPI0028DD7970|nr:CapA family protein [Clostridium sp. 19966]MDT8719092.1 CapA family protein [Clostridium sp. 19966]